MTQTPSTDVGSPSGPGSWVGLALAEQEEHIRRQTSCGGVLGRAHSFDTFSSAPGGPKFRACWRCKVTETREDYAAKISVI